MTVSYERQTTESPNPLARFAHRSRIGRAIGLTSRLLPPGGTILDFAAGTGSFLSELGKIRPDALLYAIEPYMPPLPRPGIRYLSDMSSLRATADVICAFEVCEHLSDDLLASFFEDVGRSLNPAGRLIISVPIMIGAAVILKEMNRSFLFKRKSEYSFLELASAVVGGGVERPANRLSTHKGFDFRSLRALLEDRFVLESEMLSPLPLPWWLNSQAFFVCRTR